MVKHWTNKSIILVLLSAVGLFACSDDGGGPEATIVERVLDQETYSFEGMFENEYNGDTMEFKGAKVIILKEGGEKMIKPFHVDDNYVTIQMASSSLVTREDIVMRIHGMEELLTCNICAKYRLSSIWLKRNFIPEEDGSSGE